jgi:hypothetical protein
MRFWVIGGLFLQRSEQFPARSKGGSGAISFKQDGLASSEVDIGRSEIGDALVVSQMIIVSDEVADPGFVIARKMAGSTGRASTSCRCAS